MKYYSQYRTYELFDLQQSLSGLSKSNRWVKLGDNLRWDEIEREYNKRLFSLRKEIIRQGRRNGCGLGLLMAFAL